MVQEEAESDSEDHLPDISCLNLSPGHDRNDQTQIQSESTSKDEPEPDFTQVFTVVMCQVKYRQQLTLLILLMKHN